jgi:hypothetical protein
VKIKFLKVTESDAAGFPFRAGQVIDVAEPTPAMLRWLEPGPDGERQAEVVKEEPRDEMAVAAVGPERAVTKPVGRPRAREAE